VVAKCRKIFRYANYRNGGKVCFWLCTEKGSNLLGKPASFRQVSAPLDGPLLGVLHAWYDTRRLLCGDFIPIIKVSERLTHLTSRTTAGSTRWGQRNMHCGFCCCPTLFQLRAGGLIQRWSPPVTIYINSHQATYQWRSQQRQHASRNRDKRQWNNVTFEWVCDEQSSTCPPNGILIDQENVPMKLKMNIPAWLQKLLSPCTTLSWQTWTPDAFLDKFSNVIQLCAAGVKTALKRSLSGWDFRGSKTCVLCRCSAFANSCVSSEFDENRRHQAILKSTTTKTKIDHRSNIHDLFVSSCASIGSER